MAMDIAGQPSAALTKRPRRALLGAAGVATVGLLIGGWFAHWTLVEGRFQTITAGRVYQSGTIPPEDLVEVVREHGIRTVFDFRRGDDEQGTVDAEAQALSGAGVRHVHLPTGQVPPPETVKAFLEVMDDPRSYPVLIHCYHGTGRSSLFSALYRIEYEGWANERARKATRLIPEVSSFSLGNRKGIFLRDYVRRAPIVRARQ